MTDGDSDGVGDGELYIIGRVKATGEVVAVSVCVGEAVAVFVGMSVLVQVGETVSVAV